MSSISANGYVTYDDISMAKRSRKRNSADGKSSLALGAVCPDTHCLGGNTFVRMATVTMVRARSRERAVTKAACTG